MPGGRHHDDSLIIFLLQATLGLTPPFACPPRQVLSLGGSVPPAEVFKLFRGREPSTQALLRHNDLVATA